jgi:hypothetical protein
MGPTSNFSKGIYQLIALLSIVLTVALLGLTVYGLHRYQNMEVEYNIDRSSPLPPLLKANPQQPKAEPSQFTSPALEPGEDKPDLASSNQSSWQEEVLALKLSGDLNAALAVCKQEYPLWGAYNQACIIIRTQIKQDQLNEQQLRDSLSLLYRLAATAELLHDKSGRFSHLPLSQLKRLDLALIIGLDLPYAEIGYAQLRLIRKSDIRLMTSLWGRPLQHQYPRQFHQQWWTDFTARLA